MEQVTEEKAKILGKRFYDIRKSTTTKALLQNCEVTVQWLERSVRALENDSENKKAAVYKSSLDKYTPILYSLRSRSRADLSAEYIGGILKSRSSVLRYEAGSLKGDGLLRLTDDQLTVFATLTGTHLAYLKGETDEADPRVYAEKVDTALSDAIAEHNNALAVEINSLKIMFGACGYQYESIAGTGAYEFDGLNGSPLFAGPHKLTDPAGVNETVYLSDLELQALQARLGDTVAFECFRIKRGRDKENGNG